jgi:putative ABC transport system permease protein
MGRWLEENMGGMFPYFRIEPATTVAAIVAAVALGALAGSIPAYLASRLQIVEALRRID